MGPSGRSPAAAAAMPISSTGMKGFCSATWQKQTPFIIKTITSQVSRIKRINDTIEYRTFGLFKSQKKGNRNASTDTNNDSLLKSPIEIFMV